jgi:cytochrome P450
MTISVERFYKYESEHGPAAANRLLFSWLSNDDDRKKLYADMIRLQAPLYFWSSASKRDDQPADERRDFDWIDGPRKYDQRAVLLVHHEHVEHALVCSNALAAGVSAAAIKNQLDYSNSPYQGLGGYFMLALDDPTGHDEQRQLAMNMLDTIDTQTYDALATLAFKAGALVALKQHEFDLSAMAENIAARYVLNIFGFAQKDIALILDSTRKIGRGLQYQIMGRHFAFEPETMINSRAGLAALAKRASEIIGLYVADAQLTNTQKDEKEEIDTDIKRLGKFDFQVDHTGGKRRVLSGYVPILQRLATSREKRKPNEFGITEKGLIAACLMGGSVTNIQNAICICMAQVFTMGSTLMAQIRKDAIDERTLNPDAQWLPKTSKIADLMKEAMRVTPPVVFIPRRTNKSVRLAPVPNAVLHQYYPAQHSDCIPPETLVLLGLGGASCPASWHDPKRNTAGQSFRFDSSTKRTLQNFDNSEENPACPYAKIFGGAPNLPIANTMPTRWTYTHSCPGMGMAQNLIAYCLRQLVCLPSLSQVADPDTGKAYGLEKRWGLHAEKYRLSYQREAFLVQTPLQTILPVKAPVDFHSQQLKQVIALGAPFIEKVLQDSEMVHFASFIFTDNDSKLMLFTMYDGDFDTKFPIRDHPFEFVQYLKQFVKPSVGNYYFSAYPETPTHKIAKHFTRQFDYNVLRGKQ